MQRSGEKRSSPRVKSGKPIGGVRRDATTSQVSELEQEVNNAHCLVSLIHIVSLQVKRLMAENVQLNKEVAGSKQENSKLEGRIQVSDGIDSSVIII